MKRLFNLFAVSFILSFIFSICAFSEEPPKQEKKKLSEKELWNIYYDFIAKIKPYDIPINRQEHEKEIKPVIKHINKTHITTMMESYVSIGKPGRINVEIDEYTGEIRYYAVTPLNYYNDSNKNEIDKAKMKKEEAIEKAKSFLFLAKEIKLKEYSVISVCCGDEWSIYFHRKLDGYEYKNDLITIVFSEKYGLLDYVNNLFSDECNVQKQIDKERAEELGLKYFLEINKKSLSPIEKKIVTFGPNLFIINPALLKSDNDASKAPMKELRKSRLVWLIGYMGCSTRNQPRSITIYIDPITEELIYYTANSFF